MKTLFLSLLTAGLLLSMAGCASENPSSTTTTTTEETTVTHPPPSQ